jgi:hypothetical protein
MKPNLLHQSCVYILPSHFLLLLIDLVNSVMKLYTKYLGGSPSPKKQIFYKALFLIRHLIC